MKLNYRKINEAVNCRWKLPRKVKKAVLGLRKTKNQIKEHYRGAIIFLHKYPTSSELTVEIICPKCGCHYQRYNNHNVGYPEVYWEGFCARCNYLMCGADNSPVYQFYELDEGEFVKEHNIRLVDIAARERYNEKILSDMTTEFVFNLF